MEPYVLPRRNIDLARSVLSRSELIPRSARRQSTGPLSTLSLNAPDGKMSVSGEEEDYAATQAYAPLDPSSQGLPRQPVVNDDSERDGTDSASLTATPLSAQRLHPVHPDVLRARARLCADFGFRPEEFCDTPKAPSKFPTDWLRRAYNAFRIFNDERNSAQKMSIKTLATALGLSSPTCFYTSTFTSIANEWHRGQKLHNRDVHSEPPVSVETSSSAIGAPSVPSSNSSMGTHQRAATTLPAPRALTVVAHQPSPSLLSPTPASSHAAPASAGNRSTGAMSSLAPSDVRNPGNSPKDDDEMRKQPTHPHTTYTTHTALIAARTLETRALPSRYVAVVSPKRRRGVLCDKCLGDEPCEEHAPPTTFSQTAPLIDSSDSQHSATPAPSAAAGASVASRCAECGQHFGHALALLLHQKLQHPTNNTRAKRHEARTERKFSTLPEFAGDSIPSSPEESSDASSAPNSNERDFKPAKTAPPVRAVLSLAAVFVFVCV